MSNHPPFVEILREKDPELFAAVDKLSQVANKPGALDQKTKVLISLALDAFNGAIGGVKTLSEVARKVGATEEEIKETLRMSYYISGMQSLVAGAAAYPKDDSHQ